jgi:hypothetical protein
MNNTQDIDKEWQKADAQVFWGEIAPSEHVVQIYENDKAFLDLLIGFVIGGLRSGESVIIIATSAHILAINEKLKAENFDPFYLGLKNQYIALDAAETLSKFMIDGWPDENLFRHVVSTVLARARKYNRHHIRAFGEMVALLWAKGYSGATVKLEHLWKEFCEVESFCLFCAYPQSGFTEDPNTSMMHICETHSKVIRMVEEHTNEIVYRNVV